MHILFNQSAKRFILVEPIGFASNEETSADNSFQGSVSEDQIKIRINAMKEFESVVKMLKQSGCDVLVLKPIHPKNTPDAVFPNNWFSLGPNGILMTYPMKATSRSLEVHPDLAQLLRNWKVSIKSQIDWTSYRNEKMFLEGTGSLVLDHQNKTAFVGISERSQKELAIKWGEVHNYEVVTFETDHPIIHLPIYHTNVLLSILSHTAVVCSEVIAPDDRHLVLEKLKKSGRSIIEISFEQMCDFCGNLLEVRGDSGQTLVAMSSRAYDSFHLNQKETLQLHAQIIHVPIPTIETIGGGGIRCMLAEVFN